MPLGERRAQGVHAAVGITVELACGPLDRFDGSRERREPSLVRRDLDATLEAELALHLLDGLARLVRDEVGDRSPKELRHSSLPRVFRQKRRTPPTAASPAAVPALMRVRVEVARALCFASSTTSHPTNAFRLLKIVTSLTLPDQNAKSRPAAGGSQLGSSVLRGPRAAWPRRM